MQIAAFSFESLIPDEGTNAVFDANTNDHVHRSQPVEILPPPAPSFSEAELETAKQVAYEEGFMAGKVDGKREIDHEAHLLNQEINQVFATVQQHLDGISQQHQQYLVAKQADLGRLVLGCAERLAVEALRKEPLADVEAMVRDCLGLMMGKPEVLIQAHPKLQPALAKKFSGNVKVIANAEMNPVDCYISWGYGEATREIDKIWSHIEETIDRYFAVSATEMSQQSAVQSLPTAELLTESLTESSPEGENHG